MLKLHYLNVGHGDCIIVEFTDANRTMMIDINRSSEVTEETKKELVLESLSDADAISKSFYKRGLLSDNQLLEKAYIIKLQDPIQYLRDKKITSIFRFISTHPHMDHISGLSELHSQCSITNFWIIRNSFILDESDMSDTDKKDWKLYKSIRDSAEREYKGATIVRPKTGDSFDFWKQDNITILSPNDDMLKTAEDNENQNIMSYVLLVEYGGHKIIFGGDAEEETWKYIVENHADKIKNVTILDASHHGRDSGYYKPALELMKPIYVLVSVGKKPESDASNKYRNYSDNVWSTRWKGNIYFEINADGSGIYRTQFNR